MLGKGSLEFPRTGAHLRLANTAFKNQTAFPLFLLLAFAVSSLQAIPPRRSTEKQRSERGQVSPPNHPCMRSRRLHIHFLDPFRVQPRTHFAIQLNPPVIHAASNPQNLQLLLCLGVQRGEILVELFRNAARAKSANPRKLVQVVEARE